FDGQVYFVPGTLDEKTVRAMITSRSGEPVHRDEVLKKPEDKAAPAGRRGAVDWFQELRDPDPARRRELVRAMSKVVRDQTSGQQAAPEVRSAYQALTFALRDQDPEIARAAAQALGVASAPGGKPLRAFLAALPDEEQDNLAGALARSPHGFGRAACPGLLRALGDDDYAIRARAAHLLRRLAPGSGQHAEAINQALAARQNRLTRALDQARLRPAEAALAALEFMPEKARIPGELIADLARAGRPSRALLLDLFRDQSQPAVFLSFALATGATTHPRDDWPNTLPPLSEALNHP